MSTLQERMNELFPEPRRRGLQADIRRLCGVKASSVSAWFNQPGKVAELDRKHAEKICLKYAPSISPAWLAEGVPPKERPTGAPAPEPVAQAADSPPALSPRFEDNRTLDKEDWRLWQAFKEAATPEERKLIVARYELVERLAEEKVRGLQEQIKKGEAP